MYKDDEIIANGGAQITDQSKCVCVTIRPVAIWLNDYLTDNERQRMIPLIERAMDSATTDINEVSRRLALLVIFANQMATATAKSAVYAAMSAKSAAMSAAMSAEHAADFATSNRGQIIDAAFEYLDAALPN